MLFVLETNVFNKLALSKVIFSSFGVNFVSMKTSDGNAFEC
jgi:hypothetical protein